MLKAEVSSQPQLNRINVKKENQKSSLEEKVNEYKHDALSKIKFSVIIKPAIISLVALFLSFFLDLSKVPILGNITVNIAKLLFPTWQPATETFTPYSFWWLPVVVYLIYLLLAFIAYNKLKIEVNRTPATETIDKILSAYTTIIDSISTALPLVGAAILLISIKLGEEVFLGLSVPFEVKALIVLALGKLFEPVLDQLGLEFQSVVNHITDMRDKYYSKLQVRNTQAILKQLSSQVNNLPTSNFSQLPVKDLEAYKDVIAQTKNLSSELINNFKTIHDLLEKINSMQSLKSEKVEELKSLAQAILTASQSLADDKTLTGLKHLESIVVRR